MKVPQDIILQSDSSGNWIIYNVFTHTTLAVDTATLHVLSLVSQGMDDIHIAKQFNKTSFKIWSIGKFSNTDGLLADPTHRVRSYKEWPAPKTLDIQSLLQNLKNEHFIVDNDEYSKIFSLKTSLLDKTHIGNFHQQLGQALILDKRVDPGEWWVKQKFKDDFSDLNDTLYKAVQGNFLKKFFQRFTKNHKILDIGCGVGYYTKQMGASGAHVLGIDPNKKYIEMAQKNAPSNVQFKVSEIGAKGSLDWIESNSYDFVFMSDALLFYFVSPDPNQKQDITILFDDIKRILKKNGRFFSMEPHGVFWLRPWLGEEERPFTILTEHHTKHFNVAPNYAELLDAFLKNGFILRDFKELYADGTLLKSNSRATKFAQEFPLWWIFELEPEK
jgi:SAM-dependent methyltransferase